MWVSAPPQPHTQSSNMAGYRVGQHDTSVYATVGGIQGVGVDSPHPLVYHRGMEMTSREAALWDRAFKEGYAAARRDGSAPQPDEQLRTAAENLQRLETPFGAYQRWAKDGNTADADKLQAWDDARVALSRALVAGSATLTEVNDDD
jgi:hypothetical protein